MSREQITFPNVEAQVRDYLTPLLDVTVERIAPERLPPVFVRVVLNGTTRRDLITAEAMVTLECWAPTDAEAEALSRRVYGALCAMDLPDGTYVPDGEDGWAGGPYPSPDPESGTPRYVMTCLVTQEALVRED